MGVTAPAHNDRRITGARLAPVEAHKSFASVRQRPRSGIHRPKWSSSGLPTGIETARSGIRLKIGLQTGLGSLEGALYDTAVNPQGRAGGCRRQRTGDVRNQGGNLFGQRKSPDERGGANLLEELHLEILE